MQSTVAKKTSDKVCFIQRYIPLKLALINHNMEALKVGFDPQLYLMKRIWNYKATFIPNLRVGESELFVSP